MTGRAMMTGNATMTGRGTGCLDKSGPRKKVFGHFLLLDGSIWTETMLYDQGISLRRSRYPTCLYSEKNLSQAPRRWPFGPSAGRFPATGPDFGPKIRVLLLHPGFRQWPVCNPRRYLRFGTFGSIFSGRSAARRAVFRPPSRILAQKSFFCYRTPNFVNGPFVTLCETVDLAPLDRFLKFSFPSYGPKWPKMA